MRVNPVLPHDYNSDGWRAQCSCERMPEHGKTPHAGHLNECQMRAPKCPEHPELQIGCSICHNAMQMRPMEIQCAGYDNLKAPVDYSPRDPRAFLFACRDRNCPADRCLTMREPG